jgi:hypothetical protein
MSYQGEAARKGDGTRPNKLQIHLLLRKGLVPISNLMGRLLTEYAAR